MAQIPIRMPKMSMTMTEGDVSEWFVGVGDTVAEGDVICEVLTDKVDMEVESPAAGVITSIVVEAGTVDVGEPIGFIEGDDSGGLGDLLAVMNGEPADTAPVAEHSPTGASEPSAISAPHSIVGPAAAVPRARSLADEHGVDLGSVTGSGPAGLIVTADVESAMASSATSGAPAQAWAATPETPSPQSAGSTPAATPEASSPVVEVAEGAGRPASAAAHFVPPRPGSQQPEVKPPSDKKVAQIRARVAAKMTESASVPQFTLWRDVVLDEANPRRGGVSWTTVLLCSYAAALRQVPELLCRWDTGSAVDSGPPAVGLAVATPHGLLAPTISEPDRHDPHELDQRIRALVATAQTGRVDAAYLNLANGMLSNLGGLGVDRFQALVTPPQGSVLAVGSVKQRPVAVAGGLGTALTVTVGLTIDHRIADGAHGAALLNAFVDTVTRWGEPDTPS